jgi:hypothetical protein
MTGTGLDYSCAGLRKAVFQVRQEASDVRVALAAPQVHDELLRKISSLMRHF